MMLLPRIAATVVAALALVASVGVTPAAAAGPDVYTTPGAQAQNGRLWNTRCAKYSPTIVRCTTDIWATQVVYSAGRYAQKTGWHFNNLTYLPSARKAWVGNPLAANGKVKGSTEWTSAGRRWRTECDTPATGTGACRSYIWTHYLAKTGSTFTAKQGWVFNNIVRLAEGSVKPVTKLPADILDQSYLTPTGFGPVQIGMSYRDLVTLGYVRWSPEDTCRAGLPTPALERRGIWLDVIDTRGSLTDLTVGSDAVRTRAGARVGMTLQQVYDLYGGAAKFVRKSGSGGDFFGLEVIEGRNSLTFITEGGGVAEGAVDRNARITFIVAGPVTDFFASGC